MIKQKIRGLVSLNLLFFWIASTLSGFILYLAPEGQRSGRAILLFGLTKHDWVSVHTWISFIFLGIILLHVIIDWRLLIVIIKLLLNGSNK